MNFLHACSKRINIEGSWYQHGVYHKNIFIGDIGLHFLGPQNTQVEIGYTIAKPFQRRGFGKESVLRILQYLFEDLKKHRIVASLDPKNESSIRLLESVGFRMEGCFKKSICVEDRWEDSLVYALLKEEWIRLY